MKGIVTRIEKTQLVLLIASVVTGLTTGYHFLFRPWHRQRGATEEEVKRQLPGDDLLSKPCDETTRAITVEASSNDVWPWIVQLGQGRGGFYSHTWLENLARVDIHNLDYIDPKLQDLKEGDTIRMAREDYWLQSPITSMTVKRIVTGRTMVLQRHAARRRPVTHTTPRRDCAYWMASFGACLRH